MLWTPGQTLLKQFTVECLLGQGGMGDVYLVSRAIPGRTIQFAVKTLSLRRTGEQHRKAFIGELRTWIELPSHPFITECFFFKTIHGRLAIFSEYVDGGTLREWIRRDRVGSVERILRTAIQSAMGLSVAHDCGVIHQDVKSGNILMTREGIPKITDFGIARMKSATGEAEPDTGEIPREASSASGIYGMQTTLVTSGGLTPAYGSPEQVQRRRVSRATDIWSFGVMLFEMFNRGITWQLGIQVPMILESYRRSPTGIPIPEPVIPILERCLAVDPADRWDSMDAVATALRAAYPEVTGKPWPGRDPDRIQYHRAAGELRRKSRGFNLLKPLKWLHRAYAAAGMDSLECPVQDIPEMGSAMSRLLAYLEIYQTAESILSRLMDQGRSELREEYACLLFEMYIVYHNTDDRSGAVECLDRLSDLLEEMIREKPGDWVLENRLGVTRMEKAGLIQLESPEEALALLETIIPVFQGLQGCPDPVKILENLSRAYTVAANATTRKGDKAGALELFNAAEDVVFRKMKITGQTADMDHVLILMNRAGLDSDRSRRLIQKDYLDVLKILNRVDPAETSQDHLGFKVVTTIGYAETLIDEGKYKEALALVEAACRLVEDIIQRDGWRDLLEERGGLRVNAAECLIGMGRLDDADRSVETAIAALETQYFMHDNSRGIHFLGQAYRVKARILHRRGRTDDALMFLDEAETILENARTERDQAYLDRHIQMVKNLRSVIRNDSGE